MRKIKNLGLVFACISMLLLVSCFSFTGIKGNGKLVVEDRNVADFSKIKVATGVQLFLSQGDKNSVRVMCDGNVIEYLSTKVSDETLKIKFTENVRKVKSRKVYVTFVKIDELTASSGSSVESKELIKFKNISIKASSGASVDINMKSMSTDLRASSGASIDVKGNTGELTVKSSSGSDIDCDDLMSMNCNVSASSGSSCDVYAKKSIQAKASSGASIDFYGKPTDKNISKSSGGSVREK